jgi:peptide/nickel transport system permease protein
VPILFGIVTIAFFVTHVLPGEPTYSLAPSDATEEDLARIRHEFGFDRPLYDQYVSYLGKLVQLDLGTSLFTGNSIAHDFGQKLPITLELVIMALALALLIGLPLGIIAAHRAHRATDRVVRTLSIAILSMPEFWFGLILLYVFFLKLGIARPPAGQLAFEDTAPTHITGAVIFDAFFTGNVDAFLSGLAQIALPLITMGVIFSAPIMRLMRSSVLEVLGSDYVRFGRSCGLPKRVLWRYTARAALPPVVTYVGVIFTLLFGGAILVETIFSWPGAGLYVASGIFQNDYDVIQGFVVISGVCAVVVYLLVDLLYMVIDPRVRL